MGNNEENEYWRQLIIKLKKFDYKNDLFMKMFKEQIKLKNRHTINFDNFRTKSKKINDYFN